MSSAESTPARAARLRGRLSSSPATPKAPPSLERWSTLASAHGTPVYITVWDLLPPSKASYFSRQLLGVGVFHTNIWIPDLRSEYAFGGHDADGVTGIFALPTDEPGQPAAEEDSDAPDSDTAPRIPTMPDSTLLVDGLSRRFASADRIPAPGAPPFPGARYIGAYFVGYAGAPEQPSSTSSIPGDTTPAESSQSPLPSPRAAKLLAKGMLVPGMNAHGRWAAPQSGPEAFKEPELFVPPADLLPPCTTPSGDATPYLHLVAPPQPPVGASPPRHPKRSGLRARSLAHVLRTLSALRASAEWHGPSYDLLRRNCNHFAAAFLRELCGARAQLPAWINRAAWLGDGVQRIIPSAVLERAVMLVAGVDDTNAPEPEPGAMSDDDEEGGEQDKDIVHETARALQREQHAGEQHR